MAIQRDVGTVACSGAKRPRTQVTDLTARRVVVPARFKRIGDRFQYFVSRYGDCGINLRPIREWPARKAGALGSVAGWQQNQAKRESTGPTVPAAVSGRGAVSRR